MTPPKPTRRPDPQSSFEVYLREINDLPLLTAEEERELAARAKEGDPSARERLAKANLRLVVNIARGYAGKGLGLEDLIAEGNLGLWRATEDYDGGMETRFSTYASYWIKQSIRRAVINKNKPIRLPAHKVSLLAKTKRAARRLTERLGRTPTPDEVSEELRFSKKQAGVVAKAIRANDLNPHGESARGEVRAEDLAQWIDETRDTLRLLERSALFTADPIERVRLDDRIEAARRRLFGHRKRRDVLLSAGASECQAENGPGPRSRVFISATQADRGWAERLLRRFESLGGGLVEFWDETRAEPGTLWRVTIQQAVASSKVIIPLVSADYLASDFVVEEVLPLVTGEAESGEAFVLPVVISPCRLARTRLARFLSVNNPSSPLTGKTTAEQDRMFDHLARSVTRYLAHAPATD